MIVCAVYLRKDECSVLVLHFINNATQNVIGDIPKKLSVKVCVQFLDQSIYIGLCSCSWSEGAGGR